MLAAAYAAHPERFVKGRPQPADLPTAVWINPPAKNTTAQDAPETTIVTGDNLQVDPIHNANDHVVPVPAFSSLRIEERGIDCHLYNACTDDLPFPDSTFDAVLLCEVLEHVTYSPLPMLREIRRVLRPDGTLLLSTPNPAGLGKFIKLALGGAPLESHLDTMIVEGETFEHKGLTFFRTNRESKLWAVREIAKCMEMCGLAVEDSFYYGNTIPLELMSGFGRLSTTSPRLQ